MVGWAVRQEMKPKCGYWKSTSNGPMLRNFLYLTIGTALHMRPQQVWEQKTTRFRRSFRCTPVPTQICPDRNLASKVISLIFCSYGCSPTIFHKSPDYDNLVLSKCWAFDQARIRDRMALTEEIGRVSSNFTNHWSVIVCLFLSETHCAFPLRRAGSGFNHPCCGAG